MWTANFELLGGQPQYVRDALFEEHRAKTSWTADIFTSIPRPKRCLTPTSSSALVNLRIGAVNSSPDVLGHYRSYFIIFRRRDMKIWFDILEEESEAKTSLLVIFRFNSQAISRYISNNCQKIGSKFFPNWTSVDLHKCEENPDSHVFNLRGRWVQRC